jgi:hypothetical protein
MDLLWFYRYKRDHGKGGLFTWEFSSGLCTWEQAPAPAQIGRRLVEGVFEHELPAARAGLVNNLTHWGYGMLGGVQYGIVAGSAADPRILYGIPFGATVWAMSYVLLPLAKLYKPIWEYDCKTLAKDLSAHLVYGLATATAFNGVAGTRNARKEIVVRDQPLVAAALLGLGGGLRSFAPPVALAIHGRGPFAGPARFIAFGAAAVELIADKQPQMVSRWTPRGLALRLGFSSSGGRDLGGWGGAGVASVAALAAAFAGSRLRGKVRGRPAQLAAAVAEDALSYGLVLHAVRRTPTTSAASSASK